MRQALITVISVPLLTTLFLSGCGKARDTESSTPRSAESAGDIIISSAEPEMAEIGSPITISGEGFGNRENHSISIGGNGISVEMEVVEWQPDKIVAKIPDDPRIQKDRSYYYRVQSNDYKESSNLLQFSFK